jgi:hypothetical protein
MPGVLQVQSKDTVIKLGEYPAVNAIQNFSWDPRFNEDYMMELGNSGFAGVTITPEITASFELNATGSSVALLRRMIVKILATEFNGYLAGDPAAANPNTGMIKWTDLENAVCDIIEVKAPGADFTQGRATLLPRAHLSSINIKADASGKASETYNFEGDLVRIFPTTKRDLVTVPVTRTGGTETIKQTAFSVDLTTWDSIANDTSATWQIAFFMIDEVIVPTSAITVGGAGTGLFSTTTAYPALAGQRLSLVLSKVAPGTFPTINYPTSARFVKSNNIDIFLVPTTEVNISSLGAGALQSQAFVAGDRILRVQSIDMTIDLRREALRQIAKSGTATTVYYRGANYPLNVTASVNVLETTMADHARLEGLVEATDILDLDQFENKTWQLVIRYYFNNAAIQTTAFIDAQVTGRGTRMSVGGRGEISWSFTGSQVMFDGT